MLVQIRASQKEQKGTDFRNSVNLPQSQSILSLANQPEII